MYLRGGARDCVVVCVCPGVCWRGCVRVPVAFGWPGGVLCGWVGAGVFLAWCRFFLVCWFDLAFIELQY